MTDYIYRGARPPQPEQPTLVMLHGAGMDHTVWTMLARYHARRGYNVIAPDLPGHGRSTADSVNSIEAMSSWLEALLKSESVSNPYFLGHSMGSLVAMETAARLGDNCAGLAMFGTTAPMVVGAPLLEAAKRNEQAAIDMVCLFGHDTVAQLGGNLVGGVNVLNTAVRLMQQAGPDVLFNALSACNNWVDALDRAELVRCPTSLVLGRFDKMTPQRSTGELKKRLKNCKVTVIDSGHMLMSEAPEATHQALKLALRHSTNNN